MTWIDVLSAVILQVVQVGAVALIGYAFAWLAKRSKTDQIKSALAMTEEAAKRAVTVTSQTFVDGIKGTDKWNKDAAVTAFEIAMLHARDGLSEDAKKIIMASVGDINAVLAQMIEEQVHAQKEKQDAEVVLIENKEA